MNFDIYTYGNKDADPLLVQMADDHDMEVMDQEAAFIKELTGGTDFCLAAVKVNDWNRDLAPWPAPPVFGKEAFGDGAGRTLDFLLKDVLPSFSAGGSAHEKKIFIGGYSLAGLFALWAGTQTDVFSGIAAASPSIWYPSFVDFTRDNLPRADRIYLSLGDKEERTRNPVMARVGDAIREEYALLQAAGKESILEWNKGNHFKEPDLRTAKAFSWLIGKAWQK